jgi:hypothetical protein
MSYVYIIGRATGPVKVGISNNPWSRLEQLKTGCPFPVEVLFNRDLGSRDLAIQIEQDFHAVYEEDRLHGEWFDMDDEAAICGVETAIDLHNYFASRGRQ